MGHAEWLIKRILFLKGTPTVSKLNPLRIGKDVAQMVGVDKEAEAGARAKQDEIKADHKRVRYRLRKARDGQTLMNKGKKVVHHLATNGGRSG
jgi:bacterioferritin (cytochrome b1)